MEAAGCSGLYIYSEDFGSGRRNQRGQDAGDETIEEEVEPMPVDEIEPEPEPEPVRAQDAGSDTGPLEPSGSCSIESKLVADLTMHNTYTDRTVAVFWVDFDCKEHSYGTIAPGATKGVGSYVTHPWLFRNPDTNELYKEYIPTIEGAQDIYIP